MYCDSIDYHYIRSVINYKSIKMKKGLIAITIALFSINAWSFHTTNESSFDELKKLEGKWIGTLERTDGSSDPLILEYSVTSAGSALLEESNTGGVEMLSIFNAHNEELLITHYCGLQNKPCIVPKPSKIKMKATWDLVQPFFMFIVGVSIPFSYANRKKKGETDSQIRRHAIQRTFLLLLFGWGLYCIGPEKIVFKFDNVLAQLSFTYLISFLLLSPVRGV